jgi:hypothetical protein
MSTKKDQKNQQIIRDIQISMDELINVILNSDFNLITRKREILLENLNNLLASKQNKEN